MAGDAEVGARAVWTHHRPDSEGTVGCRDAAAAAGDGVDGDGERRPEMRLVAGGHGAQTEGVDAFRGEGDADEPPGLLRHEVDVLGRRELSGHYDVAFVLAVFVVDEDDHAARSDGRDRVFDRSDAARGSIGAGGRWGVRGHP